LHKKSKKIHLAIRELTETRCQLTAKFGMIIATIKDKGDHIMKIYGEAMHADQSGVFWWIEQLNPPKNWKVEAENEDTAICYVEKSGESNAKLFAEKIP